MILFFKKYSAKIAVTGIERKKWRHTTISVAISINRQFQDIIFKEYPTTKLTIDKTTCIVITYLMKIEGQVKYFDILIGYLCSMNHTLFINYVIH